MRQTFVASMAVLHTWCGLICGWIMFAVFLTGALSVFWMEIGDWGTPTVFAHPPAERAQAIERGIAYLQRTAPDAAQWRLVLPSARDRQMGAAWDPQGADETIKRTLDPATGQELRRSEGGWFFVYFHERLHIMGKNRLGFWIVGAAAVGMLVSIVSGVLIHRRIFRDFFLLRWWSSRQRTWTDVHNVLGVLPLPFHVMIILSGLAISATAYLPPLTAPPPKKPPAATALKAPGKPPPARRLAPVSVMVADADRRFSDSTVQYLFVTDPGRPKMTVRLSHQREDRVSTQVQSSIYDGATGRLIKLQLGRPWVAQTQFFLRGFHFAQFGGLTLRWLFFLSGLAGAGVMAAGLTLFSLKRAQRSRTQAERRLYALAARLNVAAIAGPTIATAAYLWGMRLIPADIAERPQAEVNVFYAAVGLCTVHALVRPAARGWIEQLLLAALLFAALPLADIIDHGMDIVTAAKRGAWSFVTIEAVAVTTGALLALAAGGIVRGSGGKEVTA